MAGGQRGQAIPTQSGLAQFEQFVLPHFPENGLISCLIT
jgi:hypothetical protein